MIGEKAKLAEVSRKSVEAYVSPQDSKPASHQLADNCGAASTRYCGRRTTCTRFRR